MTVIKSNPDLMERLLNAQNDLIRPIDIVTFSAFCDSRSELLRHVEHYEQVVSRQNISRARVVS